MDDDNSPVIGKPTVFVIDDDSAVRRLIEHLLSREGLHVETFDSAPAFLLHYQSGRGTCILVNVDMPAMSGIELVKTLQRDPHAPPIIVVTAEDTVAQCRIALRNGAWDFLPKPIDHERLVARVQRAIEIHGQRSAALQDTIEFARRVDQLTERERFVMERMASGQKVKQIAKALGIGFQTVSKHGIRAFQKLHVENEIQLALKLKQVESLGESVRTLI